MATLNEVQRAFAETLFDIYEFLPTRALYLDLEGSGGGIERGINAFLPRNADPGRFHCKLATPYASLGPESAWEFIDSLELSAGEPKWVVVFAVGDQSPHTSDERERLEALFGEDPFPNATWVNLHFVVKNCAAMVEAIEAHRNVWWTSDKIQTRKSLEALEWEFGIVRDPSIRSHSYSYVDGREGKMHILNTIQSYVSGLASDIEAQTLMEYCRADVDHMFKVARECELGLFDRDRRSERWSRLSR